MPLWSSHVVQQGEQDMPIQTGAAIVAALAAVYGIGFAVLPMHDWSAQARSWYTLGGAGLIGLLLLALVIIPWFIQRG